MYLRCQSSLWHLSLFWLVLVLLVFELALVLVLVWLMLLLLLCARLIVDFGELFVSAFLILVISIIQCYLTVYDIRMKLVFSADK